MSGARRGPVDVCLIGLGAAGGIAARVLTAAGLEVVALEAGPRVEAGMMALDELRNDVHGWLSEPKAAGEVPTYRPDPSVEAGPCPWPMLMVNAVGGSSVHYAALSARFQPWNFSARSGVIAEHGAAAIPAGSTIADWPLAYEELEPYYDAVEREIGVAGAAGVLASGLQPGGNPFEGPRRRDYPLPPLRRSGWTELTADAARRLGWHPYPAPAAINSLPYNGHPECTYCGFCTYNGCYRNAKGSTDVNAIPRAEATGLLRVETGARATRIEVDRDGLASGVTYVQEGVERFQPARVVLLGSFTYENTRLLLLSTSPAFPRGLSNNHDRVGRDFIAHPCVLAYGLFPGRALSLFNGVWAQATCVDDWNTADFDHGGLGFVGGALLTASQEAKPIAAALASPPPGVPRWGSAWKAWLAANAQSVGSAVAQFEGLSYEQNRLDLDPLRRDRHGLPVVRITHRLHENERRGCAFMTERLQEWLREAGAAETWAASEPTIEGRHSYGGTRMGDDPASSVVDRHGLSHEVPNLGVLGASTFPTSGAHNPTLTVQALAWRTAQHVVDAWGGSGGLADARDR